MKKKKRDNNEKPRDVPSEDFINWWNPHGTDVFSGASLGGHADARRIWARKDPGRWTRRTYGIDAHRAWLAMPYRCEYLRWLTAGKPKPKVEFVSIAATLEQQRAFWRQLKDTIAQIGKPMPKAEPRDYDKGTAPIVEPIDELQPRASEEDDNGIPF
jgi:hypothetical protein